MQPATRISALHRLADLALASGDAELRAIGGIIQARLAGEIEDLDRALGLVRPQGQRSGVTLAAHAERNAALLRLRQGGMSPEQIAEALDDFAARRWPRLRGRAVCPPEIAGTTAGELWAVMRVIPRTLTPRQIRRLVAGHEQPVFMSDRAEPSSLERRS